MWKIEKRQTVKIIAILFFIIFTYRNILYGFDIEMDFSLRQPLATSLGEDTDLNYVLWIEVLQDIERTIVALGELDLSKIEIVKLEKVVSIRKKVASLIERLERLPKDLLDDVEYSRHWDATWIEPRDKAIDVLKTKIEYFEDEIGNILENNENFVALKPPEEPATKSRRIGREWENYFNERRKILDAFKKDVKDIRNSSTIISHAIEDLLNFLQQGASVVIPESVGRDNL